MTSIFIAFVSLLGAGIQSTTGFGYAVLCMSLWTLVLPVKAASALQCISVFVMTLSITLKYRKHINIKLLVVPLCASLIGSTVGLAILMNNEETSLKRILGAALILLSIYFVKYQDKISIKPSLKNSLLFGFISGLSTGLFSMGGPPIVVYYLAVTKDKLEYTATLQGYFIANGCYVILKHALYGNFTAQVLNYSLYSISGVIIGMIGGLMVFNKLSQDKLRKTVYGFMAVMGMWLMINP